MGRSSAAGDRYGAGATGAGDTTGTGMGGAGEFDLDMGMQEFDANDFGALELDIDMNRAGPPITKARGPEGEGMDLDLDIDAQVWSVSTNHFQSC